MMKAVMDVPFATVLMVLAGVLCFFAAVPAVMFLWNLRWYREPGVGGVENFRVAVLIPARNEERNIGDCVESVLAGRGVALEVLVLDDASTDGTAEVVREIALRDARVRLVGSRELPQGWNGKQHACWVLAQESDTPLMLFLDADVRVAPDAVARCVGEMRVREVALLSGFPRQVLGGWAEWMLLPLIHFVLLGLLPMGRMRKTRKVAYAAGCGQFFLAEREAYFACGGHAAIRDTRHDGLRLPEEFRRHGLRTDLVDLTELAEVRMYESASEVWMGLAKNATEGLGSPGRIVPVTVLLLMGQVLPVVAGVLWVAFWVSSEVVGARLDDPQAAVMVSWLLAVAVVGSYLPRVIAVWKFKQPRVPAVLHPVGILMLLGVQWYALGRQVLGRPVEWRARSYSSETGKEVG
jgi:glycosyltransferase involved in cell wall biosynthesis